MPKAKVFISYRRDDSAFVAQIIYDKLAEHYGKESVMFDVDAIPKGVDFVEYLNEQVAECDVLLAVMGHSWLDVRSPDGSRRLDDPEDFVRIEIEAALNRKIPLIPVLVGNVSMPKAGQLPDGMKSLSRRNASEVRAGVDFQSHLTRLVRDVDVCLEHIVQSQTTRPKPKLEQKPQSFASATTGPPEETGKEIITDPIDMQLKLLEPGTFLMGAEKDQRQVTLTDPFWLGIYPVTQVEYKSVLAKNPSLFIADDRRPVETVSWLDAIDFCNRLSEMEDLSPYYDVKSSRVTILGDVGYRLPTEAEWEYACRAGSDAAYCFGDDDEQLEQYAWYDKNSGKTTHAVGQKQPNGWGLYDMHGNVWEWCWDWYGKYRASRQEVENPTGPSDGVYRMHRGGGWNSSSQNCRSAFRSLVAPLYGNSSNVGFRVARSSVK